MFITNFINVIMVANILSGFTARAGTYALIGPAISSGIASFCPLTLKPLCDAASEISETLTQAANLILKISMTLKGMQQMVQGGRGLFAGANLPRLPVRARRVDNHIVFYTPQHSSIERLKAASKNIIVNLMSLGFGYMMQDILGIPNAARELRDRVLNLPRAVFEKLRTPSADQLSANLARLVFKSHKRQF